MVANVVFIWSTKYHNNNIKFIGWKEKAQEDLRSDFIAIMKQAAGVTIEPSDILEIHCIRETGKDSTSNGQTQKQ